MLFPFCSRFVRSKKKCSFYESGSTSRGSLAGLTFYISIIFLLSVLTLCTSSDIIFSCLFIRRVAIVLLLSPFLIPSLSHACCGYLFLSNSLGEVRSSMRFHFFAKKNRWCNSRPMRAHAQVFKFNRSINSADSNCSEMNHIQLLRSDSFRISESSHSVAQILIRAMRNNNKYLFSSRYVFSFFSFCDRFNLERHFYWPYKS